MTPRIRQHRIGRSLGIRTEARACLPRVSKRISANGKDDNGMNTAICGLTNNKTGWDVPAKFQVRPGSRINARNRLQIFRVTICALANEGCENRREEQRFRPVFEGVLDHPGDSRGGFWLIYRLIGGAGGRQNPLGTRACHSEQRPPRCVFSGPSPVVNA